MDAANFRYDHPIGTFWGYIGEQGLRKLWLPPSASSQRPFHFLHSAPNITLARTLRTALESYLAGIPASFDKIPLDLTGGISFQTGVWFAARELPWGSTATYGEIGKKVTGGSGAARAVGNALGANPILLLIPCHRILAAGGRLGGFSAGLERKCFFLSLENSWPPARKGNSGPKQR